ncbi:hypothetical protein A2714_02835 [Candidatus Woesebacteria bacterium RIFCSPHIGHO2_01_FULL_38_9]|uniref:Glycosyl transferase family 1 domain-containing protein n=2 Tax=Candidatus Woeseibacteriota TaxID=1752722 RepID=A0A1F7XY41_9BACT|nr:MAG: hypothetical protein A2714_02835 [Candidatus Woesebacteria bacterium RIFCSPHIGHO2_01_FULL_38_9]OGM60834.1 MAG: hypothetical protein A3A75_00170 [Candidatus Woesebacteria bacterium RIFCSPLOWO2_01_FULL_39_10]
MGISIFAKMPFRTRGWYLARVSSIIRAQQVSDYLGAKLNPEKGYENDVCIYIKPHVKEGQDFKFEGKPYLDIIDGWGLVSLLKRYPEVSVIACSELDFETLSRTVPNKIVLIPQHHCNFERVKRTRKEKTTVGVIGTPHAFPLLPQEMKPELAKRGMNLWEYSHFFKREDIIDFYQKIDVQIVWRPYSKKLANPLKIVNAASFGIPTIALDEPYFKEMRDCYIPVHTLDEFLNELDNLRSNPELYEKYAKRCLKKAEEYHIENIAKLYQELT